MRLSLRFILPLLAALALIAYATRPLVDRLTTQWFIRDLEIRADLIATTVHEPMEELTRAGNRSRLLQFFARIAQDERIFAVGYCPTATPGRPLATARASGSGGPCQSTRRLLTSNVRADRRLRSSLRGGPNRAQGHPP